MAHPDPAVQHLLDILEPLLDPDFCQPFGSAWELECHARRPDGTYLDGETLHEQLAAAVTALRSA